MINDEAVIERLHDAVTAYTAQAEGRPDSLDALLLQPHRHTRRRSVVSMAALATGVAAAVAAIVFGATTLQGPSSSSSAVQPSQRSGIAHFGATRITTPTDQRYPSSSYTVARRVTKLTRKVMLSEPVIVHTPDLTVARTLPISLMGAQLTADGTRLFGYYAGAAGHEMTANSDSSNAAVKALVNRDTAGHAVYLDFATGDLVDLGKAAWPGIVGMTVTPDGSTVAYSRIVKPHGPNSEVGENSIIRVVDIATAKWHEFTVPKHHQTLGLALSPDATKLAFTETGTTNILFLGDLSQPNPAASARAVVPQPSCRKGAYDFPTWMDSGLYVAQQCEPDARGIVEQVVRIDPATLLPAGPAVAPLPDGGATQLAVANSGGALQFLYLPVRSATPYDHGDMVILFHNNESWQIRPGDKTGQRTGLLWGW